MSTQLIVFPTIPEIQDFFFEAALASYASGAEAKRGAYVEGRFYPFTRGDFHYRDEFIVNGEYSCGQTIIHFQRKPIWIMQYHGWCKDDDPKVLAFLKEALRDAYEASIFHGGRGSVGFPFGGQVRTVTYGDYLMYRNDAGRILQCDFHKFSGVERIYRSHDKGVTNGWKEVFWYRYQGMLLIPADSKPQMETESE